MNGASLAIDDTATVHTCLLDAAHAGRLLAERHAVAGGDAEALQERVMQAVSALLHRRDLSPHQAHQLQVGNECPRPMPPKVCACCFFVITLPVCFCLKCLACVCVVLSALARLQTVATALGCRRRR